MVESMSAEKQNTWVESEEVSGSRLSVSHSFCHSETQQSAKVLNFKEEFRLRNLDLQNNFGDCASTVQ